ncbi:MAG: RdgB/HAM1 family non-canonical purine NTP pyrophosphatase [Opitutaceae bacterium]|nr:RdgB/HAM1 family non-canonical purine NTP pyrophosphatase [Opitutaceae bacterium]
MKLYLASGNDHKAAEFAALAQRSGLDAVILPARAVGGMPEVVEDTGTFAGNAGKKARALRPLVPRDAWVLADDSGVCVDALDGGPGVESAYYAGPQHDAAANLWKLVEVMRGVPAARRGARFVCVLVLLGPDGQEKVFEGRCEGVLLEEPRGGAGFGYDPIFRPAGHALSYAELGDAVKSRISHRAVAWAKLADYCARLTAG